MNRILVLIILFMVTFVSNTFSADITYPDLEFQRYCKELAVGEETLIIVTRPLSGEVLVITDQKKAFTQRYSPGSVIKPVIALIALESNLITPFEEIDCQYMYFKEGNQYLCSWAEGHGRVNMRKAIAVSCNVYFYYLIEKTGSRVLLRGLKDFHCTEKAGLIFEDEVNSIIPSHISPGELTELGIGLHNQLKLTPVKLIQLLNIIPTRGRLVSLHQDDFKQENQEQLFDWDTSVHDTVINGMTDALKTGTGKDFKLEKNRVAGKTGTAPLDSQVRGMNRAFFYCFYPLKSPEISILVIHKTGYGSTTALPIAEKVLEKYLEITSKPTDTKD